jgi:anion-transporting  ArsA/GET3 family ATPase
MSARSADRASASDVRLHIVTGKGGTGKTTVAAALAIALARGGRRTLLVEVEGRQGIAQLFDTPPLPYSERSVCVAPDGGEVLALAVDAEEAMLDYLEMFYNLKIAARALKRMGAVDFVTTIAPGMRDVLLTGKVKEAVTRRRSDGSPVYDAVVLDAPPTGRIHRFLDATKEVAKLTKVGPIHKQSEGVVNLLHGPQAVVHIVTLLEEMPVQETLDAAADLSAGGFTLGSVVVNRGRGALVDVSYEQADELALLKEGLSAAGLDASLAAPLAAEVADYVSAQQAQAAAANRLDALGLPVVALPELSGRIDLGALYELAAMLGSLRSAAEQLTSDTAK